MAAVGGLGRSFDVLTQIVPVDLADGANTGHRVNMKNYEGIAFVGYLAAGTAGENPTFDVKQHTANTGGTSADLDVVDVYHEKVAATLAGTETWTKVTQTAASEVTDADWDDANQVLVAIEILADQLTDGYTHVSVDVADPGTAHIGCVLAIGYGLQVQRAPGNLAQPNA